MQSEFFLGYQGTRIKLCNFAPKSERKTYRRHARVRERVRVCACVCACVRYVSCKVCKVSSSRGVFPLSIKELGALHGFLQACKVRKVAGI